MQGAGSRGAGCRGAGSKGEGFLIHLPTGIQTNPYIYVYQASKYLFPDAQVREIMRPFPQFLYLGMGFSVKTARMQYRFYQYLPPAYYAIHGANIVFFPKFLTVRDNII